MSVFIIKRHLYEIGVTCCHPTDKKIENQKGQVVHGYTMSKKLRRDLNQGLVSCPLSSLLTWLTQNRVSITTY